MPQCEQTETNEPYGTIIEHTFFFPGEFSKTLIKFQGTLQKGVPFIARYYRKSLGFLAKQGTKSNWTRR